MRSLFYFLLLVCVGSLRAQITNDVYIQFSGQVLSSKDTSIVDGASIQYEKLPYYDDMGIGRSSVSGNFEFYLIKGLNYSFSLKKEGFEPLTKEVVITDDGSGRQQMTFMITPIVQDEPDHFTLENLIFARGSAVIAASSFEDLDKLANFIVSRPSMVIQLEGHTDFDGNADANMRLSQARVESVKTYLLDKGVKKDKVLTKAFGGTQPLSTDRTDIAKEKNRRVEVSVISR